MLRIKPITENDASDQVKQVYNDIKITLDSPVIPLIFQYIANFEEYFIYQWGKIKANIQNSYFTGAYKDVIAFTKKATLEIYNPSLRTVQFGQKLHAQEKEHLLKTTHELQILNAKLLIITIGLREGVKGVVIGQDELLRLSAKEYEANIFDMFHTKYDAQERDIEPASRMLAPLFGSQSLAISQYPSFFSLIAEEMETVVKKENYLDRRVELERLGMKQALGLPYAMGTSYQEIISYAGHRSHLTELIYIMAETFPTQFPRLLITTIIMEIALMGKSSLAIR